MIGYRCPICGLSLGLWPDRPRVYLIDHALLAIMGVEEICGPCKA